MSSKKSMSKKSMSKKSMSKRRRLSNMSEKSFKRSSSKTQDEVLAIKLNDLIEKNKKAEQAKKYKTEIENALKEVKEEEKKIIDDEEDEYKVKMIQEIVDIVYDGREDDRYCLYNLSEHICDMTDVINPKKRKALEIMAARIGVSSHDIKTLDSVALCEKIRYGEHYPGLSGIFLYGFLYGVTNGLFGYRVKDYIRKLKDQLINLFLTNSYIYNSVFLNDSNATVQQRAYWLNEYKDVSEILIRDLITEVGRLVQNKGTTFMKDILNFQRPRTPARWGRITPKEDSELNKMYEILNYILSKLIQHRDALNNDKEVLAECERLKTELRHEEHMMNIRNSTQNGFGRGAGQTIGQTLTRAGIDKIFEMYDNRSNNN